MYGCPHFLTYVLVNVIIRKQVNKAKLQPGKNTEFLKYFRGTGKAMKYNSAIFFKKKKTAHFLWLSFQLDSVKLV